MFKAAKQSLKLHFGSGGKLPMIKDLRKEMSELYSDYYSAKNELKELSAVKKNIESYFNFTELEADKSQERETMTKQKNKDGLE